MSYLQIGWLVFHRVLVNGPAFVDVDYESDERVSNDVDSEMYERCMAPVLRFCDIVPDSLPPFSRAYRIVVWRRLSVKLRIHAQLRRTVMRRQSFRQLVDDFEHSLLYVREPGAPPLD